MGRSSLEVERVRYRGHLVKVEYDPEPANPRTEYDNVAELWCWHRRYNLGDEDKVPSRDPMSADEIRRYIKEDGDEVYEMLPLFLYDHSGITMRTAPFSCPWDSGQVGWAIVRKSAALKEQPSRFRRRQWALRMIRAEVETYDHFLTGQVYGYRVHECTVDEDGDVDEGEEIDSCWGFEGDSDYALQEGKNVVDAIIAHGLRKRIERLKQMIRSGAWLQARAAELGVYSAV